MLKKRSRINHNLNTSATYLLNDFFASFTANNLLKLYEKRDRENTEPIDLRSFVATAGGHIYTDEVKTFTITPTATFTFYQKNPRKYLDIAVNNTYKPNFNDNKTFNLGFAFRGFLDKGISPPPYSGWSCSAQNSTPSK